MGLAFETYFEQYEEEAARRKDETDRIRDEYVDKKELKQRKQTFLRQCSDILLNNKSNIEHEKNKICNELINYCDDVINLSSNNDYQTLVTNVKKKVIRLKNNGTGKEKTIKCLEKYFNKELLTF